MTRPRLLDLYCGAGGAARGFHDAGFDVVGVDHVAQPRYPYTFVRADSVAFLEGTHWWAEFDAVHASPPCQRWTRGAKRWGTESSHPDLIAPTRDRLSCTSVPYVLENVPEAPLRHDVTLCGAMFGLRVVRHRAFECQWFKPEQPRHLPHHADYVTVTGHTGRAAGNHRPALVAEWREAMGIGWMTRDELAQAVPPAYTRHIGRALLDALR